MNPINYSDPSGKWWVTEHQKMTSDALASSNITQNMNRIWKSGRKIGEIVFSGQRGIQGIGSTGLMNGVVWPDMPEGGPLLVINAEILGIKSSQSYRSHYGDKQFWHFMFDKQTSPETVEKYLAQVKDQIQMWVILGRQALGRINPDKKKFYFKHPLTIAGEMFGRALHIIQDSYCPSHASRNENMELKRIQDYSDQTNFHRKNGDYLMGADGISNERYFKAATQSTSKFLDLVLAQDYSPSKISKFLDSIFKFNDKTVMGGTEKRFKDPDEGR
jgi:hypothetical protein